MEETQVRSLGKDDPLEKRVGTPSCLENYVNRGACTQWDSKQPDTTEPQTFMHIPLCISLQNSQYLYQGTVISVLFPCIFPVLAFYSCSNKWLETQKLKNKQTHGCSWVFCVWTHFLDFADWIRVLSMLKFSSEGQDTLPVSIVIELLCRCMSFFFFFFAGFLLGLHWASSGYSTEVHNYLLSSSRLEAVYLSLTFSLGRRKLCL